MSQKAGLKRRVVDGSAFDAADVSRHLLKGEEEERRRISRELHDETGQSLMVLRFQLETIASAVKNPGHKAQVQESLEVLDRTIEGLRRIIARLSPRVLEEFGLLAAIRRHAQLLTSQSRMKARVELPEEISVLDHDIEVALYRSVQEALHNIAKHSRARNFVVRLYTTSDQIHLEVDDDGTGVLEKASDDSGFGLTGMRERATALGGSMTIESRRGRGTQIRIVLPCMIEESSNPEPRSGGRAARRASTAKAS